MIVDFSKKAFDIMIVAGQSNAEGFGFGDADCPWQPDERVWYLSGDYYPQKYTRNYVVTRAAERVCGNEICGAFDLSFAETYLQNGLLAPERDLLIVRAAVSSTGFLNHHWGVHDDLFQRMIEMTLLARSLNVNNRLIALLWHQGEEDVALNADQTEHYKNVLALVTAAREKFDQYDLPFVAGDFVPQWKQWKRENGQSPDGVVSAMRNVCHDVPFAAFVESNGLTSNHEQNARPPRWEGWNNDMVHFSRNALSELGKRYFSAFCTCIKKDDV